MKPGPFLAVMGLVLVLGAPAGAVEEEHPTAHRVEAGETLSHIALLRFGDQALWPAIYEANRDQIKDPSMIYPGQELAIPILDSGRRDAARRESHDRTGS